MSWSDSITGGEEVRLEDVYVEKFDPILDQAHLELFREAVRLGGAEFADKLVAECKALLSSDVDHAALPPPIDPHKLNG